MVKHQQNNKHRKNSENSEASGQQDSEDEPKELLRKRFNNEDDDLDNKFKMSEFHRPVKKSNKSKQRAIPVKKRIRDIERLLDKNKNLPEEIKQKKIAEMKELKKTQKSQKEAEKFADRYKKIKFFEKRKVIRNLDRIKKQMSKGEDNENKEELEQQKQLWTNHLSYIDNYPPNWKYISLFAKTGDKEKDEAVKETRDKNMERIMKTVDYKIQLRDREIAEADRIVEQDKYARKVEEEDEILTDKSSSEAESQDDEDVEEGIKVDESVKPKKKQKEQKLDPFFAEVLDDDVEKRVVQRDGQVPKLQKNIEKQQREKEERQRRWMQQQEEKAWAIKSKKPIKINPSNYRVSKSQVTQADEKTKDHHVYL